MLALIATEILFLLFDEHARLEMNMTKRKKIAVKSGKQLLTKASKIRIITILEKLADVLLLRKNNKFTFAYHSK